MRKPLILARHLVVPVLLLLSVSLGPWSGALAAASESRPDPAALLAEPAPEPLAAFPHWPPLAIAREIWAEEGIGPARVAVMERAQGPKTVVMARTKDHPVGVAFVAVSGGIAMLHALEVRTAARRQGSANNILRVAARWALDQGASTLSLVVTEANAPARALYASLGMQVVGQYHYRQKN